MKLTLQGLGVFGLDGHALYTRDRLGVTVLLWRGTADLTYGGARVLDPERLACQQIEHPNQPGERTALVSMPLVGPAIPTYLYTPGPSDLAAGAGAWTLWRADGVTDFRWSLDAPVPPNASVGDIDPFTGQIVVREPGALRVYSPTGAALWSVPADNVIHVRFRNGRLLWQDASLRLHVAEAGAILGAPSTLPSPYEPIPVRVGADWWLVYHVDGPLRLVAHPWDSLEGYLLGTGDTFNIDALALGSDIVAGWSVTAGEDLNDGRVVSQSTAAPRISLVPSVTIPEISRFNHPVLICPFKDPTGESGADSEVVVNQTGQVLSRPYFVAEDSLTNLLSPAECLGIYTEAPDPWNALAIAKSKNTRVAWCWDQPTAPQIPAILRPWDVVFVELYRFKGETLERYARWFANVRGVLEAWPGDVGLIPMCYCGGGAPPNELWTVQEALDGLSALSALVNLSQRIKVVAPFSFNRANGITAHPELREAFNRILAATPGRPTLTPVGSTPSPAPNPTPIPAPPPSPTPAPTPEPHLPNPIPVTVFPKPDFPEMTTMSFDPAKIYYACIGKFRVGVSPTPVPGKEGDDAYPIVTSVSDEDSQIRVTDQGNGAFSVLFVNANRQWSFPPTQDLDTPSLGQTREAGAIGGWEKPYIKADPDNPNIGVGFRMEGTQSSGVIFTVAESY